MEIRQSVQIMKALADTSRMRIARLLAAGPRCVEEVSNRLGLAQSTVSFHLKKLEQAGLVSCSKEQYYSVYRLSDEFFSLDLLALVAADDSDASRQDERERQNRRKTLAAFMPRGRLLRIPAQKKKRLIVLEEIAGMFEPGREYAEKEVNAIIARLHDDHCAIRRWMIDEGFMERDARQVYRLPGGANDVAGAKTAAKAIPENAQAASREKESGVFAMDRKKELKRAYLEAGTTAGVVCLRCKANGRVLLMTRQNINGYIARVRVALEAGKYFIAAVQKDWNEFGEDGFEFKVLDTLTKADLAERDPVAELEALKELWREKLAAPPANATFY